MIFRFDQVKKLLDAAKDQSCVNCGVRDGTVVAAHYTGLRANLRARAGHKPHDLCVADLCHKCHYQFDVGGGGATFREKNRQVRAVLVQHNQDAAVDQGVIEGIPNEDQPIYFVGAIQPEGKLSKPCST